jgi:hypothetical protein
MASRGGWKENVRNKVNDPETTVQRNNLKAAPF